MYNLNIYRTTVGAQGVGIAQAAFDAAFSYAQERITFGQSIINHQSIGNMLADMATQIKAARLLVHHAAWLKDSGAERVAKDASMAKLYGTEMAKRVVDMALQIHGGNGLVRGSVTERLYRAVRALTIYEGSSEIQRIVINNEIQREAQK
jgi:acyl-CoA dehydrogenase